MYIKYEYTLTDEIDAVEAFHETSLKRLYIFEEKYFFCLSIYNWKGWKQQKKYYLCQSKYGGILIYT